MPAGATTGSFVEITEQQKVGKMFRTETEEYLPVSPVTD
jgi:hypothetical protein